MKIKKKEIETQVFDTDNKLLKKTINTWVDTDKGGYYEVNLVQVSEQDYEGDSVPKIKNTTFVYDDFGNVIVIISLGETSITGDEKYEYYEYLNNSGNWILDKLKNYQLYDSDNSTVVRETNYSYDNQSYGTAPVKGDLTKIENWYSAGENSVIEYEYDSYGNVIKETDPNGNEIEYVYGTRDITHTYPDKVINAKGHTINYFYDIGRGNILSQIDTNGVNTSFEYDVFGRKTKEILVYDDSTYPTKEIIYDFDGIAPEKITQKQREESLTSNTYDTYTFYDGFGRVVQTKKEAESDQQIVMDVYYDDNNRVSFQTNPYLISYEENYTEYNETVRGINYTYDGLDRVIKIVNPDFTAKTYNYSIWNITVYDENNNKQQFITDAYGKTTYVYEFNEGHIYETLYIYDTAGDLIQINDSLGNTINFSYDSLGRKTELVDPDLGTWTYSYDSSGNLIEQTDAESNIITISYDSLNRVITKNTSDESISFTYDGDLNGTLTEIQNSIGQTEYSYDNRLRVTEEIKTYDNIEFKTNYSYDAMDRVISLTRPDGLTITYDYNNQGLLNNISDIITDITYNELGLPLSRDYTNNLISEFSYDEYNLRLESINTSDFQSLEYTYDNVGNILNISDNVNSNLYEMQYDDLNRLTHAARYDNDSINDNFNFTFAYNSIGNILNVTLGTYDEYLSYSYNQQNPVHSPLSITYNRPSLVITDFEEIYSNEEHKVFRVIIENVASRNVKNIDWNLTSSPP